MSLSTISQVAAIQISSPGAVKSGKQQAAAPSSLSALNRRNAGLPNLAALGHDLLVATRFQRLVLPLLPLLGLALFVVVYSLHWYALLPLIILAHFIVTVTYAHDVVHGSAGLSSRATNWVLFGLSILLIESAHSFRITHLHHHSHCLEEDDFEGAPARFSLFAAFAEGPTYLQRLWLNAFKKTKKVDERCWMVAELIAALAFLLMAVLLSHRSILPLIYFCFMWIGSWLYPIATAWLPHFKPDNTPLGKARTLRGKIIPTLLGNLSYHLEHHLYPQVPGCNLPSLAERLNPYFAEQGVKLIQVY